MQLPYSRNKNPLLVFCRMVLFPLIRGKPFVIDRPEKYGGKIEYTEYAQMEAAFASQTLFPADLKAGLRIYDNMS